MNERVDPATVDITTIVETNPVAVLVDEKVYARFYEHVKREVEAHKPDLGTEKGRKAIASLAYKVTRTKTALDNAGKQLNEEARKQINAVDATRRKVREELDALAETVRKPLTEWEEQEAKRAKFITDTIEDLAGVTQLASTDDSAEVEARIARLGGWQNLDEETFGDDLPRVQHAHEQALAQLRTELDRVRKAEADRLELERLRQKEAEREAADAAAAAEQRAEAEARRRSEAAVEQAREEERRNAAAALAAAEAERQALIDQQEQERQAREAEEGRAAEEQALRLADKEHRKTVMAEAVQGLVAAGADAALARTIILAIAVGQVPNVRVVF